MRSDAPSSCIRQCLLSVSIGTAVRKVDSSDLRRLRESAFKYHSRHLEQRILRAWWRGTVWLVVLMTFPSRYILSLWTESFSTCLPIASDVRIKMEFEFRSSISIFKPSPTEVSFSLCPFNFTAGVSCSVAASLAYPITVNNQAHLHTLIFLPRLCPSCG